MANRGTVICNVHDSDRPINSASSSMMHASGSHCDQITHFIKKNASVSSSVCYCTALVLLPFLLPIDILIRNSPCPPS